MLFHLLQRLALFEHWGDLFDYWLYIVILVLILFIQVKELRTYQSESVNFYYLLLTNCYELNLGFNE